MKNRIINGPDVSLNPPLRVLSKAFGRGFATEENLIFPRPRLTNAVARERVAQYFGKQTTTSRSQLD